MEAKKAKKESGITLIALVVTIIVLLILAGVTIYMLSGDNGILRQATDAKTKTGIVEEQERLDLEKYELQLEKKDEDITVDEFIEHLIKKGIVNEKDVKRDEYYECVDVVTDNGYNANISEGDIPGDIIIVVEGRPDMQIKIRSLQLTPTNNSIKVTVNAIRTQDATFKYYYKTENGEYTSNPVYSGSKTTYTITGLKSDTKYTVKVVGTRPNETDTKEAETKTTKDLSPTTQGKIEFGDLSWDSKSHTASVSITSSNTTYDLQYKINGESYQKITSGHKVTGLKLDDVVYARLWNGTTEESETSITVKDEIGPQVKVTKGTVSSNSIEVSVTATDNEAGMGENTNYKYYIKKHIDNDYKTFPHKTTNTTYKFTGLEQNTSYDIKVETEDKAKNNGTGELKEITTESVPLAEGIIKFSDISWDSNTHKASVTITTENDNYKNYDLQYRVVNGDYITVKNGLVSETSTRVTDLNLKDVVYARLWDGTNGGNTASITVDEKIEPNIAQITFSTTVTDTKTAITADVTQSDSQSGLDITNCKWVFNTKSSKIGTDSSDYPHNFSKETEKITLEETTTGTYYLHVLSVDKAGNKRETISDNSVEINKPGLSAPDIKENEKVIGAEVKGYEVNDETYNDAVTKWRIFLVDSEHIYLIASDYIPIKYIPGNWKLIVDQGYDDFIINQNKKYQGAANIANNPKFNTTLGTYHKWVKANSSNTDTNIKTVAYMLDTDDTLWGKYAGPKAEYAIGGPTIEMFCESYKKTHPSKYIEYNENNKYGYTVKWSGNSDYRTSIEGLIPGEYDGLYVISDKTNASTMWIASPSGVIYNYFLMLITYDGHIGNVPYTGGDDGFRPVVCLKSDVKLQDNGDGTYTIMP